MPPKTFPAEVYDIGNDSFSAYDKKATWRVAGSFAKFAMIRHAIFDHLAHLHANDGVDEEEHCQEEADVGQRFERLHEGPQQDADRVALPQQFNEAGRAEKAKKADVYESNIVECFLSIKIVSL